MKNPRADAANAGTSRRPMTLESGPNVGESARSTPDAPANTQPMIHATRRSVRGLRPQQSMRSGLSTTARSARPRRVNFRNRNSATIAPSDTAMMISWSWPTFTPPMSTVSPGRRREDEMGVGPDEVRPDQPGAPLDREQHAHRGRHPEGGRAAHQHPAQELEERAPRSRRRRRRSRTRPSATSSRG